jgi:hypothetical protein
VLLHVLAAFTPDGTPLGTLTAQTWVRDEESVRTASLTRAQRAATPFVQKESYRWVETLQQAQTIAHDLPQTQLICVADSEADIYELLVAGQTEPRSVEWIVRACQNRAVVSEEEAAAYVREQALAQAVLFTQTIKVRGRQPKQDLDHPPRAVILNDLPRLLRILNGKARQEKPFHRFRSGRRRDLSNQDHLHADLGQLLIGPLRRTQPHAGREDLDFGHARLPHAEARLSRRRAPL